MSGPNESKVRQLQHLAEQQGLTVRHCGNGHYQILGGSRLVNYYPNSRKKMAYVDGTRGGLKYCSPLKAVNLALAGTTLPAMKFEGNRKRHKGLVKILYWEQNALCYYCGQPMIAVPDRKDHPLMATKEHLIPLGRGGRDVKENIVLAHKKCNEKQNQKDQKNETQN